MQMARVLGGIEAQSDLITGRFEVEHAFEQNRIAAFETPTRLPMMLRHRLRFRSTAKSTAPAIFLLLLYHDLC